MFNTESLNFNNVHKHFAKADAVPVIGPIYGRTLGSVTILTLQTYEAVRNAFKGIAELFGFLACGAALLPINAVRLCMDLDMIGNPFSIINGFKGLGRSVVSLIKIPQLFLIYVLDPSLMGSKVRKAELINEKSKLVGDAATYLHELDQLQREFNDAKETWEAAGNEGNANNELLALREYKVAIENKFLAINHVLNNDNAPFSPQLVEKVLNQIETGQNIKARAVAELKNKNNVIQNKDDLINTLHATNQKSQQNLAQVNADYLNLAENFRQMKQTCVELNQRLAQLQFASQSKSTQHNSHQEQNFAATALKIQQLELELAQLRAENQELKRPAPVENQDRKEVYQEAKKLETEYKAAADKEKEIVDKQPRVQLSNRSSLLDQIKNAKNHVKLNPVQKAEKESSEKKRTKPIKNSAGRNLFAKALSDRFGNASTSHVHTDEKKPAFTPRKWSPGSKTDSKTEKKAEKKEPKTKEFKTKEHKELDAEFCQNNPPALVINSPIVSKNIQPVISQKPDLSLGRSNLLEQIRNREKRTPINFKPAVQKEKELLPEEKTRLQLQSAVSNAAKFLSDKHSNTDLSAKKEALESVLSYIEDYVDDSKIESLVVFYNLLQNDGVEMDFLASTFEEYEKKTFSIESLKELLKSKIAKL